VISQKDLPARHHNILLMMGAFIYSHLGLKRGLLPGMFLIQNIVNIHLSHFAIFSMLFNYNNNINNIKKEHAC
jgi:hypothetical protein